MLLELVEDLWQRCRAFKLLCADAADSTGPGSGAWSTQRRLLEAVEVHDVDAAVAVTRESLNSSQRWIRTMLAAADRTAVNPRRGEPG